MKDKEIKYLKKIKADIIGENSSEK